MKILTGITANDHHALLVGLTSEGLLQSVIAHFTPELNAHSRNHLTENLTRSVFLRGRRREDARRKQRTTTVHQETSQS